METRAPYRYLIGPPGTRRSGDFFAREDEIATISRTLEKVSTEAPRSLILWGPAGIGKSSIAREYAYRQLDAGIDAAFWIPSSTAESRDQAFSNIANKIDLIGRSQDDHKKNACIVLEWMNTTG